MKKEKKKKTEGLAKKNEKKVFISLSSSAALSLFKTEQPFSFYTLIVFFLRPPLQIRKKKLPTKNGNRRSRKKKAADDQTNDIGKKNESERKKTFPTQTRFTICTTSSSSSTCSFPTLCGRCLADAPQISACLNCFSKPRWILLQKSSTVGSFFASTTGSFQSGSFPFGFV